MSLFAIAVLGRTLAAQFVNATLKSGGDASFS